MIRFIFRSARGYGILVPVLFFCCMALSGYFLSNEIVKDEMMDLCILLGICGVVVSAPLWIIGRKLNRNTYDPHSFLFIPMEYWGIILPIILALKNWPD